MKTTRRILPVCLTVLSLAFSAAGCGAGTDNTASGQTSAAGSESQDTALFTERDLLQNPDTADAEILDVQDNDVIKIDEEGTYILRGEAENASVEVSAPKDAKVQIILDGVTLQNSGSPVLLVSSADKVFVTAAEGTVNTLSAEGTLSDDGVIFCRSDLTLNGSGTVIMQSSANGVVCKDSLRITGGTWNITAQDSAIEANDSIAVYDGTFDLNAQNDGLHAEYKDDDTLGWIVIENGTFTISTADDAIHGQSSVTINGGTFDITGREGIESTSITINDGVVRINAEDDGLNAGQKSDSLPAEIVINGGDITIHALTEETDAVDANGDITINGGTITIDSQSSFDYDGTGTVNGGTITVNGERVNELLPEY